MTARHAAALAELADLCLQSARDLAARQLAAETAEDAAALASALHKVGRSLRQSLALEARLERDRKLEIVADLAQAEAIARKPVERRKAQVEAALERLIWQEYEGDEFQDLMFRLGDLMDEDDLHDRYAQGSAEDHIKRLCLTLGLAGPRDEIIISPTPAHTHAAPLHNSS